MTPGATTDRSALTPDERLVQAVVTTFETTLVDALRRRPDLAEQFAERLLKTVAGLRQKRDRAHAMVAKLAEAPGWIERQAADVGREEGNQ